MAQALGENRSAGPDSRAKQQEPARVPPGTGRSVESI